MFEGIIDNRKQAVEELYTSYRKEFIDWLMKVYQCDKETALDVFQEAIVTVYYHIKNRKLDESKSSIKTYLFTVGKYTFFNKSKKTRMEVTQDISEGTFDSWELNLFEKKDSEAYLYEALNRISSQCRLILTLFYFDNNSMEVIAEKVGLKNEKVAKSQKLRCLKSLRKIVNESTSL